MNRPWTSRWLEKCQPKSPLCSNFVAVTAPAPIPGPIPPADHADLGQLVYGISKFVKRLVGIAPRAEVNNYGAYGSYGKYGSYGSYPDVGGEVNGETSSEANSEAEAESLTTLTTTMPVFTTTITLRSVSTSTSTPLPTITAYCPMLDTTSVASDDLIICTRIDNSQ
ncbi:hypothetical protein LA080_014815 [Diaporthe eres]|nr:hypothetical protein LA080_014815 [Diaporthe eres]